MEKCKACFWFDVTLEKWPIYKFGLGDSLRKKELDSLKEFKCNKCKRGKDQFKKKFTCRTCGKYIDGHNEMLHGSLCDDCENNLKNSNF